MERQEHWTTERRQPFSPRKIVAISGAIMLEAAAIYCVTTVLVFKGAPVVPHPIDIRILDTTPPKPKPFVLQPQLANPTKVPVSRPYIVIDTPQPVPEATAGRMPFPPVTQTPVQTTGAQPKLQGISAPVSIGASHSCVREYPAVAQRLNQQGTTTIRFTVNANGSVSNVQIARSSGHDALDRAAIRCASSWRYKPAIENGQAVLAPWTANVRWKLQGG